MPSPAGRRRRSRPVPVSATRCVAGPRYRKITDRAAAGLFIVEDAVEQLPPAGPLLLSRTTLPGNLLHRSALELDPAPQRLGLLFIKAQGHDQVVMVRPRCHSGGYFTPEWLITAL
jgi:hypothetical protein